MDERTDYEDGEIRMRIPGYLRQKKGVRYFQQRRRQDGRDILNVALEFLPSEEGAEVILSHMTTVKAVDWMGNQQRIVRRGVVPYVKDGFELLGTSFNTIDETALHSYEIVFSIDGRWIHLVINGWGEIDFF